jgi:hypothetical protein
MVEVRARTWAAALVLAGVVAMGCSQGGHSLIDGAKDSPGMGTQVGTGTGRTDGGSTMRVVDAASEASVDASVEAGAAGPEAGPDAGPVCALSLPVQVAFTRTIQAQSCAPQGTTVLTFMDTSADPPLEVTIAFSNMLSASSIGAQAPAELSIAVVGDAGSTTSYETGQMECPIYLTENVASPTPSLPGRYLIAGTGSCNTPAVSTAPEGGVGLSVGNFSFSAYIDP